ncbi:DUF456 domain-containing protein [Crateriforma conspicua]|uniref:DUF456 domain-containing protein n=1 Tax=Crateriforma conspicua TaxID=2527996 RepID=A0A5C5YAL0_9PLAN|nr:DUF456 domain-containing protein [Crateriforma conspicua]QDV64944.1 hypothetical protein Mal65_41120 [Crateriforma conspicua]TWT70342.1 hypothetical protein Pan14r_26470 [Crateriforma conspicua]
MISELSLLAAPDTAWWQAPWIAASGAALLAIGMVIAVAMSWMLNLIALPGNWIAVGLMAIYAWLAPDDGRMGMAATPVVLAFVLAAIGEGLEFLAGAVGASRAGASRRATVYSLGGSMLGAFLGAMVGLPIPVLGPVLAALLFGGAGATVGAIYAERTDGRPWRESWLIGKSAFWGRTIGTAGKAGAGALIVVVAFIAVLV